MSLLYLTDIVAQLTSRILNKAGAGGDITSSHECAWDYASWCDATVQATKRHSMLPNDHVKM